MPNQKGLAWSIVSRPRRCGPEHVQGAKPFAKKLFDRFQTVLLDGTGRVPTLIGGHRQISSCKRPSNTEKTPNRADNSKKSGRAAGWGSTQDACAPRLAASGR